MNARQTTTLKIYDQVASTLASDVFTDLPDAPVVIKRFTKTIGVIRKYRQEQYNARTRKAVTSARFKLETMRRQQMLPLAQLARPLFAGETAIQTALKVPGKHEPTDRLLASATVIVKTLKPHRALLVQAGVDPKRIDQLAADSKDLKGVFDAAYASGADRALPTQRLPGLFSSARIDLLTLGALVKASGDSVAEKLWKRALKPQKQLGRPPRAS